jgi:hypothetical protein
MADLAKSGTPSYCSITPPQSDTIVGLLAAAAIAAGDACYIAAGGVTKATGAAANAAARVVGFAFQSAAAGDPVTLVSSGNFNYGAGMTPGTPFYLSAATAGALADAASTGGTRPVAIALDATRIRILPGGLGL